MHLLRDMFRRIPAGALLILACLAAPGTAQDNPQPQASTKVHLHWGARPGVVRYRLQLSVDPDFRDIVFDRIVSGTATDINDLSPGRYFWRVAPLNKNLGDFSSAAVIEIGASETPPEPIASPVVAAPTPKPQSNSITTTGGWVAAVGDVSRPVIAHLRSRDNFDIVATNTSGVTFALDSRTGVRLWSTRAGGATIVPAVSPTPPLTVQSNSGLDDVLVFDGLSVVRIDGGSGRELWRTPLTNLLSAAVVVFDGNQAVIAAIDNSMRRLLVLNGETGKLISQTNLPARVVGFPAASLDQNGQFFVAYESGDIELREKNGSVVRAGSAASPIITGPLVIKGRRDEVIKRQDMILVDTRDGLTGLTAGDLKALGRVTSKQEVSRGDLVAADLDGDGSTEVLLTTQEGYLLAIHGEDGKMLWDTSVKEAPQGMAFADLDGDGILDVLITTTSSFATALSGRDGSQIWKDSDSGVSAPNHAAAFQSRGLAVVPLRAGVLLIGSDASHAGLRAIEFPKASVRR
jgi:outer membrane protein assembly factor BamB